jgi:hypothetical protein
MDCSLLRERAQKAQQRASCCWCYVQYGTLYSKGKARVKDDCFDEPQRIAPYPLLDSVSPPNYNACACFHELPGQSAAVFFCRKEATFFNHHEEFLNARTWNFTL